jgi:DNA-directed RNA polymerase subunit beta'
LIPAGTGLSYHKERRRKRAEALTEGAPVEMATAEVEEAIKQALNTSDAE